MSQYDAVQLLLLSVKKNAVLLIEFLKGITEIFNYLRFSSNG